MKLGGSLERRRRRTRRAEPDPAPGDGEGRSFVLVERFWPALLGLALVGWLVGYLAATRVLFPAPPPPGDLVEIPGLAGLDLNTARERIEGAGLELEGADSLAHPTLARSLVLGQSPLPGQLARPGAPVRVTVSLGPERRLIPDVTGLAEDRARIVLEASGFVVVLDSAESEIPRGRVVDLDPVAGEELSLPAEVRIVVSSGPAVVPMPLLLGMTREEALATLDSLGLVVGEIQQVFRFGRDQGIVVEQDPAADTELQRGGEVRLGVGDGGPGREQ